MAIPGFSRTAEACRKKFEMVFKQYKEDKLANSISGNGRHECKFYDSIDHWWHQAGSVMKHVSATTMESTSVGLQENSANEDVLQQVSTIQPEPSSASKKNKFQDQALHYFGKMVDNGVAMLDHFAKTNELLQKVDQQMDRLIEKL